MPFPGLAGRVADVRQRIHEAVGRGGHGQTVRIVAVTKTHGPEAVAAAWDAGIRAVGENRVQEAVDKMAHVSVPAEWHLIGHLQRNKVKQLDRFALFHALDSDRLASAVVEHAAATGRKVPVLVQVNVSGEASKGGFERQQLKGAARRMLDSGWLDIRGAMTMAPLGAGRDVLRATFRGCAAAREILRDVGFDAGELSMGMSDDFELAVEEGATMVRLGTILFGTRMP